MVMMNLALSFILRILHCFSSHVGISYAKILHVDPKVSLFTIRSINLFFV
jgi:hypothetical protein